MTARTEATVYQPQQYQVQQQQQQRQQRKPQVYTLYPDPPIRRLSTAHLAPQSPSPSQIPSKQEKLAKASYNASTAQAQTNPRSQVAQLHVATRINIQNLKQQPTNPQNNQQQQQSHSPSSRTMPPSPVSPSKGAVVTNPGSAQREKGGVPRQQGSPVSARQYDQLQQHIPHHQPVYGGSVPRQSLSSAPVNKGVPSSSSPVSLSQGPFSASTTSPRLDRLLTEIPSSSLALSFDRNVDQDQPQDNEKHQMQALQYQQKLRQRPPKQGGEDTDDDSDSGSILSYRRSIHRLSMTYKGRPGVPNISLFASHHQQHDRSVSGLNDLVESPKVAVASKEQKGEQYQPQRSQQQHHKRQQSGNQPSYNYHHHNQGSPKLESYESASSLTSLDNQYAKHQHNQNAAHVRNDDSGRPRIVRSNTEESSPTPRSREVQVPERSTSADDILSKNGGSRTQQNTSGSQHNYSKVEHHPYPTNHLPYQPNSKSPASPNPARNGGPYEPRPSQESSQSMRSQYSRNKSEPTRRSGESARHGGASTPIRSKSPGGTYARSPSRGGGISHHPLPATARGAGAGGYGNSNLNMHPAHHLPSGGYVRPEEAVGPSNPMPEKAEDYVRQGIEFHELDDISKATQYFRTAAELGDPVGMLMYGLSVRHGWGCVANRVLAFQYLQKSAEHAVGDLNSRDSFASTAAKGELVLAIYELGICFRHGWGAEKNKKTAAYYFEIAADLGDPDAQNDLAWCYYHGIGVKKDMYKSAKYYRLAAAQGQGTIGNQWIWKDKYGGPTSPSPVEKSQNQSLHAF
ncbi:hypothetical protein BGX27_008380 [Mortierella sp. AM989]|nr:hypothetical protein BGX27_008380 [Mortierella sp. AM989]